MKKRIGKSTERSRDERSSQLVTLDRKGREKYPSVKVVPDKSLKVKDIIDRYTRGLPIDPGTGSRPIFPGEDMTHESPDMSKLSMMDRMERKDLARTAKFKVPKKQEPPAPPKEEPPKS